MRPARVHRSVPARPASRRRRCCTRAGIAFDCFEAGSEVGGNWRYGNDNGMSSAYRSLHINTSRQLMEYARFPMPEDLPDYPEPLADRGVLRRRTSTTSASATRSRSAPRSSRSSRVRRGGYDVTLRARNEHGDPASRRPGTTATSSSPTATTGTRAGRSRRSRAPRRSPASSCTRTTTGPPSARGQAGAGARHRQLRLRHRRRVLPGGRRDRPRDAPRRAHPAEVHVRRARPTTSPTRRWRARRCSVQQLGMAAMLRLAQGKVTDYGLPEPDHAVLHAHPTVSDDLLTRLGHGDITVRAEHRPLRGRQGLLHRRHASGRYDVVVYCTGYKVTFPFLDEQVVRAEDNHVDLYRRVVAPRPPGPVLRRPDPAARRDHAAGRGAGRVGRRPRHRGRRAARRTTRCGGRSRRTTSDVRKRYVASKRHTIQVDFHAYRAELAPGAPPRGERRTGASGRRAPARRRAL